MDLISATYAYVHHGTWAAECPQLCGNVERATEADGSPKTMLQCSYCLAISPLVIWPPDAEEIWAVLLLRPVPHTRNWYPQDHRIAVTHNIPHGQTVQDLRDENADHNVPTQ